MGAGHGTCEDRGCGKGGVLSLVVHLSCAYTGLRC